MNKKIIILITLIAMIFGLYKYNTRCVKVHIYEGDFFVIPKNCKHIALLGCTPHPTSFIQDKENKIKALSNIKLCDFLDLQYLEDSFECTFKLCKEHKIDHLVIAYLPIYYIGMRSLLGDKFVPGCREFLNRIVKEIKTVILKTLQEVNYNGDVSLILPTDEQLSKVPLQVEDIDERIRYLVKQFPKLQNFQDLKMITIINNKASDEDDKLINLFKYEYLFEKHVEYKKYNIGKDKFHKGI